MYRALIRETGKKCTIAPKWVRAQAKSAYLRKVRYRESPDTRLLVRPERITQRLLKSEYTRRDRWLGKFHPCYAGLVLDGEWDTITEPYERCPIYIAMSSYFGRSDRNGDIEYTDVEVEAYERSGRGKGFETIAAYYESREDLYQSLQTTGFDPSHGHIQVNIGRDGELIFNNNMRHRLALAKLLNFDTIPVDVIVRHEQWEQTRQRVAAAETPANVVSESEIDPHHPDIRPLIS